jgi:hypothetical protein
MSRDEVEKKNTNSINDSRPNTLQLKKNYKFDIKIKCQRIKLKIK